MTYEQIAEMMEEMGLPFAYHHFAEGESPAPPFLLFLSPGENTFSSLPYRSNLHLIEYFIQFFRINECFCFCIINLVLGKH